MQVEIQLKNGEVIKYTGDRIDILDFKQDNIEYKQVRYFRKGFSKSNYIEKSAIKKIIEKKEN